MKNNIRHILYTVLILLSGNFVGAQCSGGANGGAIAPSAVFQTTAVVSGNYYTFAGVAGNNYIFTFCQGGGSAGFDTQITILNNAGGYAGGYNDDNCGLSSELVWNCPAAATYRVLINTFYCTTGGAGTLAYRIQPSAGPGANCGNPYIIAALPFSATGLTTCGFINDYDNTVPCNSIYMDGEDFVFTYVASGAIGLNITLSNTLSFTGVFVVQGCPNSGGVCISPSGSIIGCSSSGPSNESWAGNPYGTFCLPGAGTYYIIVDTWPSPNCTPFDISITSTTCSVAGGSTCYNITTPAYSNDPYNSGTLVAFPDDEFSPVIPIPFPFCFMGTTFNSLVISSNGYITFDPVCTGLYSEWDTDPVPTTSIAGVQNAIMGPWQDIDPSVSGAIKYNTFGVTPNRRFVINFNNVAYYDVPCNALLFRGQIILYETTNIIGNNIANKPVCPGWNNGEAVQALTDASGTVAVVVTGRNNTSWTASNESTVFTPCTSCLAPLPVTWASFSGRNEANVNRINWVTNYEVNSKMFVLERSHYGQNWEFVENIEAAGTNPQGNSYETRDPNPYPLINYYRLRLIDLNGTESMSEIISVSTNLSPIVINSIFQQNNSSLLEIGILSSIDNKNISLTLADPMGRKLVQSANIAHEGLNLFTLDVSNLATGCYFLTIADGGNFSETRRIIIH